MSPLNAAAEKWLPDDWKHSPVPLITLTLWGTERGIHYQLPNNHIDQEEVEHRVAELAFDPRAKVNAWLEEGNPDPDVTANASSPEQAALRALELVMWRISDEGEECGLDDSEGSSQRSAQSAVKSPLKLECSLG